MREILYISFSQALKSIKGWVFSSFSATISILLLYYGFDDSSLLNSILFGVGTIILLFLVFAFRRLLINVVQLSKSVDSPNIYGEAIIFCSEAFAIIHNMRNRISQSESDEISEDQEFAIRQTLVAVCDNMKQFFDKKSNGICSVCIKLVGYNDDLTEKSVVSTFCRDRKHDLIRMKGSATQHIIEANSAFVDIFNYIGKQKGEYYLNNNLPSDLKYQNTSIGLYREALSPDVTSEATRNKDWHLPYKSEIVVPIRPKVRPEDRDYKLLGFLCVDCTKKNAFNKRYDIELMKGVADGIVDIMELLHKKLRHE